jgi:ABC-2 type transport system permease protein
MKTLDITFKDLRRSIRAPFVLVMMFGGPLLITGLLYFAFGGFAEDGGGFAVPQTEMYVADLDQPGAQFGGVAAGEMLVQFLQDQALGDLLDIQVSADAASARAAVDQQEADVALIIPPDFTAAALAPARKSDVTLYQDPTLTIGPGIVQDLVSQFIDGFTGAKIAVEVASRQLQAKGIKVDARLQNSIAEHYAAWVESSQHHGEAAGSTMEILSPDEGEGSTDEEGEGTELMGRVMAGMMIFFAFFMGANSAESIIREDEEGTLARLFTTPTPHSRILAGKFITVFFTLVIQLIVLLIASSLLFGITWGAPTSILLVTLGLIVVAAGFGVMLMSFVKNTRQTGPVMGGVLTVTALIGGLFTTGMPNLPQAFKTVSLTMPHGWALRGWELTLQGAGPGEVIGTVLVMGAMGSAFFALGAYLFRNRFA